MPLEVIITRFGYPALVIGLLLEGETVLVLAAFMAHRGYFDLPVVILLGCIVGFISDQFFFWLGRARGIQFLESRPAWQRQTEKTKLLLHRNSNLLFPGLRFMYGLRTILPFMIGMSKSDPKKFALLDFIGAFLWALAYGLAGKLIGHAMQIIFEDVKEHEPAIAIAIILIGSCIWLYKHYKNDSRRLPQS
jgi:membrane protein DedA with SNARE-associated domain